MKFLVRNTKNRSSDKCWSPPSPSFPDSVKFLSPDYKLILSLASFLPFRFSLSVHPVPSRQQQSLSERHLSGLRSSSKRGTRQPALRRSTSSQAVHTPEINSRYEPGGSAAAAAAAAANIQPALHGAHVTERFRIRNEHLRKPYFASFIV